MCIVIDMDAMSSVFNEKSFDYHEYYEIRHWLFHGKGKLVYGGTKYLKELKKLSKLILFFKQLETARKTLLLDSEKVDAKVIELKEIKPQNSFNDPHLLAILIVSDTKLLCTKEKKLLKYLKDKTLYPLDYELPIVYSVDNNIDLSSKEYLNCHK